MSDTYESTASELATAFSTQIAGKVVLITGCSPGSLAASVAQTISSHNPALIILSGRSRAPLEETQKIITTESPNINIKLLIFNLASLKSVREAAAEVNNYPEQIDVLINSAGLMACPFEMTIDGIESQFSVNHLGHFLFTNLIMDKFPRGGRILNITSGGYGFGGVRYDDVNFETQPYNKWEAYAQAKTANILFSRAIADRLGSRGISSFSLTPGGAVYTNIGKHMTEEDKAMISTLPIPIWTYDQGTATYITAAFDPEAEAYNGAFMEFCKPVDTKEECPWARGKENADKLWSLSEELIGEKFQYAV